MAATNTRSEKEKNYLMAAMTQLLEDKLNPINKKLEKLDSIDNSVDYVLQEVIKLTELENTVKELSTDLDQVRQELTESRHENKVLKERLIKQELYSRKIT